jgi:hypothetical protein
MFNNFARHKKNLNEALIFTRQAKFIVISLTQFVAVD